MVYNTDTYKAYYQRNKERIIEKKSTDYLSRAKLMAKVEALEKVVDELEYELSQFRTITAKRRVKRYVRLPKDESQEPPIEFNVPTSFKVEFS